MQGNRGQQPPRRRTRSRPDIGLSHRQQWIAQRIKEKLLEDGHPEECAICGAKGALFVNHDASGLVRGLLCGRCNRGVGLFEGSPELLQRAAAYQGRAPTPYVYGETIHLYRNKPQESVGVQKVLKAGTYEAVLDNVELKNTENGRRIKWSFRIPSEDDVVVVGWSAILSEHKGTSKWFSSYNRDKSYQWVAAIMGKTPPHDRWRPKDVVGGRCRVVLDTYEEAQGIEKNRIIKVLKHR